MVVYKFTLQVNLAHMFSKDYEDYEIEEYGECEVPLTTLLHEESLRFKMFVDARQISFKTWFLFCSNDGPMPIQTNKPCWWCRACFISSPLGVPLNLRVIKKDDPKISQYLQKAKEENFRPGKFYYEVEGNFCSFCCIKAYIVDNSHKVRYKESLSLLTSMYEELTGSNEEIYIAGDWKLIDKWQGHLKEKEFRSTFCSLEYHVTPNIKRPTMFSCATCLEERYAD